MTKFYGLVLVNFTTEEVLAIVDAMSRRPEYVAHNLIERTPSRARYSYSSQASTAVVERIIRTILVDLRLDLDTHAVMSIRENVITLDKLSRRL